MQESSGFKPKEGEPAAGATKHVPSRSCSNTTLGKYHRGSVDRGLEWHSIQAA